MGYYNLPPGSKVAEALTDLQTALRNLPLDGAIEALDLLEKITRNVVSNPREEKFRRIRTTNEKLAALFGLGGAHIMREMGWQEEGEFMVLPGNVNLDFQKHVVGIIEAKDYFKKQKENEKRSAKLGNDPAKAGLLRQLDIDRRERAAAAGCVAGQVIAAPPAEPSANQELVDDMVSMGFLKGQAKAALIRCNNDLEAAVTMLAEGGVLSEESPPVSASAPVVVQAVPPAEQVPKQAPKPAPEAVQDRPAQVRSKAPESAFDFKRKVDADKLRKEGEGTLQDLRAMQREKYKQFEQDPNAKNSAAYQKPASVAAGGKQGGGDGWFDWMWNSSSSGGGGGGGSSGGGPDKGSQKPRMRTVADLPPTRRAGG